MQNYQRGITCSMTDSFLSWNTNRGWTLSHYSRHPAQLKSKRSVIRSDRKYRRVFNKLNFTVTQSCSDDGQVICLVAAQLCSCNGGPNVFYIQCKNKGHSNQSSNEHWWMVLQFNRASADLVAEVKNDRNQIYDDSKASFHSPRSLVQR